MKTYFTDLICTQCSELHDTRTREPWCATCGSVLEARYDLRLLASELHRQDFGPRSNIWRWAPLLPISNPSTAITLGEGDTPLHQLTQLSKNTHLDTIYLKDEGRNPTGSFKDRGASVTISRCRELDIKELILASSGNAAAAFATYCARGDVQFIALIRPETSDVHKLQIVLTGSRVFDIDSDMAEATDLAGKLAKQNGYFHCTQPYNLYRIEGKKTIAFEISEELEWRVPDRILVPTSGGTAAIGLYKGYRELNELGWVRGMPKIDVVQATGCAPIVKAWRTGMPVKHWGIPQTKWVGLGHPFPRAGDKVVEVMNQTGGQGWTVDDDACMEATRLLAATEGIFVQPAAAAPIAALLLGDKGNIDSKELVVTLATGSGKNQYSKPLAAVGPPPRVSADLDMISHLLEDSH